MELTLLRYKVVEQHGPVRYWAVLITCSRAGNRKVVEQRAERVDSRDHTPHAGIGP
jgi:hypothetical protein